MKSVTMVIALLLSAAPALAHCDWINGPVVQSAREAIDSGNATLVLRWVNPAEEQEVRDAFARTLAVRTVSPVARELADRWFFEQVVRLHRRGEGEPFDGLKGAEYQPEEGVRFADQALESGTLDALEKVIVGNLVTELRRRFAEVKAAKKDADASVDAGRRYVQKYVEYVHFAEQLHEAATPSVHVHASTHDRAP